MITALLSMALLQAQVGYAPVNVEDDEILWITEARGRFWREVVREASKSPLVQDYVGRFGVGYVCNGFQIQRERLVARYFRPYGDGLVKLFRERVPAEKLFAAVDGGPLGAAEKVGQADFDRLLRAADEQGRIRVLQASDDLQRRMRSSYARFGVAERIFDRPNPRALERLRSMPDLLPFWCATPESMRARVVGGYRGVED